MLTSLNPLFQHFSKSIYPPKWAFSGIGWEMGRLITLLVHYGARQPLCPCHSHHYLQCSFAGTETSTVSAFGHKRTWQVLHPVPHPILLNFPQGQVVVCCILFPQDFTKGRNREKMGRKERKNLDSITFQRADSFFIFSILPILLYICKFDHSVLREFQIELQNPLTRPQQGDRACFKSSKYILHEILY